MNSSVNRKRGLLLAPTLGNKLGTLFMAFFVMIIVSGMLGAMIRSTSLSPRNAFLCVSILQSALAFIFPSWLVSFLCSDDSAAYLGLSSPSMPRQYLGVIFLLAFITPAMNLIIEWNEGLHLSANFEKIENWMRTMEDTAAATTRILLDDTSWWGLVSGIAVIGMLTGFAEEMMFRGGLQKALTSSGMNAHIAVWTSALIFSVLHFQFFGFVPRLLLGALFGYIYFFTGSLRVAAFAHAFNNSVVVITAWLSGRGILTVDLDSLGTIHTGQIWIAFLSLVIVIITLRLYGKRLFIPAEGKRKSPI